MRGESCLKVEECEVRWHSKFEPVVSRVDKVSARRTKRSPRNAVDQDTDVKFDCQLQCPTIRCHGSGRVRLVAVVPPLDRVADGKAVVAVPRRRIGQVRWIDALSNTCPASGICKVEPRVHEDGDAEVQECASEAKVVGGVHSSLGFRGGSRPRVCTGSGLGSGCARDRRPWVRGKVRDVRRTASERRDVVQRRACSSRFGGPTGCLRRGHQGVRDCRLEADADIACLIS